MTPSAKIASELCGQVAKIKASYTISETSKRSEVSPLSGRAGGGGGSMGVTKIIPGAARGRVSPARLRLALELSSDLSAL